MYRVGITGQQGFVGSHLFNFLGLKDGIKLIPYNKAIFANEDMLMSFVQQCDVIIHLAAMNRHEDQNVIYDTNLALVEKLIHACTRTNHTPTILFSSSTQEHLDNLYGLSKKKGGAMLEAWANTSGARIVNMVIPNVFGPFGKPKYNSFVATFCHAIARGETPSIINDSVVKLIYINELIEHIFQYITTNVSGKVEVPHYHEIKVSALLEKLQNFKQIYMVEKSFPSISDATDLALFNTFRCYIPDDFYPVKFKNNIDHRGNFVEIVRTNSVGQFSFSTTLPGITRGNHFHTRKAERFAVIKGKALIKLRKVDQDEVVEYFLDGNEPAFVDMPIWYTHNITNIGEDELLTMFWINEPYNSEDSDTWFVEV
jgi:UDP-2-acetamido-2,6-beta-L-arabino-hexul-4-ose reductase